MPKPLLPPTLVSLRITNIADPPDTSRGYWLRCRRCFRPETVEWLTTHWRCRECNRIMYIWRRERRHMDIWKELARPVPRDRLSRLTARLFACWGGEEKVAEFLRRLAAGEVGTPYTQLTVLRATLNLLKIEREREDSEERSRRAAMKSVRKMNKDELLSVLMPLAVQVVEERLDVVVAILQHKGWRVLPPELPGEKASESEC